jgi:prevent-host-death family protein
LAGAAAKQRLLSPQTQAHSKGPAHQRGLFFLYVQYGLSLIFKRLDIQYDHSSHIGMHMKKIQLRDAKANLSAVVDSALKGKPSVITRHGKSEAVVMSYEEWRRLAHVPSFGRMLMSLPDGLESKRDRSPLRNADL